MSFIEKEDLMFWKKAIIKGLVAGGVTFFSIFATMEMYSAYKPSIVAIGAYIFAEAMKYYNIQPDKKVGKNYNFLL